MDCTNCGNSGLLWLMLFGLWLVYESIQTKSKRFSPEDILVAQSWNTDYQLIVWHETRQDLLQMQHAKWSRVTPSVVLVRGTLLDAAQKALQTKKSTIFLCADSWVTSDALERLAVASERFRGVSTTLTVGLPDLQNPWALHSKYTNVVVEKALEAIRAEEPGWALSEVFESLGVPMVPVDVPTHIV